MSPSPPAAARSHFLSAVLLFSIVVATIAAFEPGLNNQFLNWDDDRNFLDNPSFQGLGIEQLRWAWSTYHLGVWQPVSWLLLSLENSFGGFKPLPYHAVSLALHILNAMVFYWLIVEILRLTSPGRCQTSPNMARVVAAASAVLFAVHPLRVEAVAWISCQPYLPATLFYMLSILAYLRAHRGGVERQRHFLWLAAAFTLYVLAVMSKAVAVSLPVVLLILDIYPLRRLGGRDGWFGTAAARAWLEKAPFIIVAVLVACWAAAAKDFNESRVPFALSAVDARLAQSAYGLVFYLYKTISPVDLIPYYDLPAGLSLWSWRYGLCAGGVLGVTLGLVLLCRRWPAVLVAWMAYVLILLPNLGIVQISRQMATDRYSYIAIMPLMILLAGAALYVVEGSARRRRAPDIVLSLGLAVAVLALIFASRRQVLVWHDSVSLWQTTLAVDPNCAVAECNLGVALLQDRQLKEASRHLSRAINLQPGFAFAYGNLGVLYSEANRAEDAVTCFERALSLGTDLGRSDLAKVHAGLGQAYAALRRDDLAWKHTRIAQELGFKDAQKMIDYLRRFSSEPASEK
jgi:protein O-mannosyl-transferase